MEETSTRIYKIKRKLTHIVRRKKPNRSKAGNAFLMVIMLLLGAFMALPLIYTVSNAFKPLDELFLFPPKFFVRNPTTQNFSDLFVLMAESWVPFFRYLFNTVFITIVGTTGHIIVASLAAFPLAKHKFPGGKMFFTIIVTSLMFSTAVTQIPNFIIMSKLGWVDTYAALIVPALGSTIGIFLMKQFMEQLPDALFEAARIDGANEFQSWWHIAMPNVKPAWLTLIIFSFQSLWNTTGTTFIYSEELKTVPYAMQQILSGGYARAGVASAVALLLMLVPITIFIISQRNIIETMATSGIKE